MKALLDTHVVVWAMGEPSKLSDTVKRDVFAPGAEVFVSPVSAYELALKHQLGRLPEAGALLADYERHLREAGWRELPITAAHALAAGRLPLDHRDPFDRILAAQAALEDMALVSTDRVLDIFDVRRLW